MSSSLQKDYGLTTENILRMYLFVWDQSSNVERLLSDADDEQSYFLWLAAAFASQLSTAIRQGLHQEYQPRHEWIDGLRGRVDFATLSRAPHRAIGRLPCEFEELTPLTFENRLLALATERLREGLAEEEASKTNNEATKKQATTLCNTLGALSQRLPAALDKDTRVDFMGLYQRQTKRIYQKLILLSRLILRPLALHDGEESMLTPHSESKGTLFETFLKKWLGLRLGRSIGGTRYEWGESKSPYLPTLNTDIAIEMENALYIFDAKCYARTLMSRAGEDDKPGQLRLDSGNLYQLYAYLARGQARHPDKEVSGGLIYSHSPRASDEGHEEAIGEKLDELQLGEFPISVHFLGMDHLPWIDVEKRLAGFVEYLNSHAPVAI